MMDIIDPHLHFFDLDLGHYHWLKSSPPSWPNLALIKQNHELRTLPMDSHFRLSGLVHIEAGFDNDTPVNELIWLEKQSMDIPWKAISYIPFDATAEAFLESLQQLTHANLVGIRDITEGTDSERLLSPHVRNNFQHLAKSNLLAEVQVELTDSQITSFLCEVAQENPTLQIVINHSGFLDSENRLTWQDNAKQLAEHQNIAIKVSGFEMNDNALSFKESIKEVLQVFSDDVVMLASNYPVCLMKKSYWQVWHEYYQAITEDWLWQKLSYTNARHIYRLFDVISTRS